MPLPLMAANWQLESRRRRRRPLRRGRPPRARESSALTLLKNAFSNPGRRTLLPAAQESSATQVVCALQLVAWKHLEICSRPHHMGSPIQVAPERECAAAAAAATWRRKRGGRRATPVCPTDRLTAEQCRPGGPLHPLRRLSRFMAIGSGIENEKFFAAAAATAGTAAAAAASRLARAKPVVDGPAALLMAGAGKERQRAREREAD